MKKLLWCAVCAVLLSGCANYKFQHGASPYDTGYVVYRDNFPVVEYTVGAAKTVPADLGLAKERFKRRRHMVEYYEKQLGNIENRFKQTFGDHLALAAKAIIGVFRLPAIMYNDHRFAHNPAYRAKVRHAQEMADQREEAQVKKIIDALNAFIAKDLEVESRVSPREAALTEAVQEKPQAAQDVAQLEHAVVEKKSALQQAEAPEPEIAQKPQSPSKAVKPKPVKKQKNPKAPVFKEEKREMAMESAAQAGAVKAIITARSARGYSPLTVHFSAAKSHSSVGRIIAYTWDFGDGDTSTKKNPVNTFWSANFDPKQFTVTLTVNDNKGNTATATQEIEVLNK